MNPKVSLTAALSFLLLAVLACSPFGPTPPTAFPTAAQATARATPSLIPPAITPAIPPTMPLSTATVAPRTTTDGPYLVYLRDKGHGQELVLMDANGKGQVAFPFSKDSNVYLPQSLSNLVSPDGIWLAFYSGSAGQASGNAGTEPADLTLNLMSLGITTQAGSTQVLARLLSADYPANFAQAAQKLGNADITAEVLQDAFEYGIAQSIAWSPDGLHLAFAGQMDGLSSDLYLYDTADGTIQQLSSGPEEVQWIDWSPDGKWILDGSCYWVGLGMTYNLYATSIDGKVVRRLLENFNLEGSPTWINAHTFLAYHATNGPGAGLERVDIENRSVDKVWDGRISSLAVDTSGAWLALHDENNGLTLINLATLSATKVEGSDATHEYGAFEDIFSLSSGPDRAFLTRDETNLRLYFLSNSGVLTSTGTNADLFSAAPNQADWIAINDNIQAFLGGGSQARIFNLPAGTNKGDFQKIIWRPDSSGIFLVSSAGQLYALDFSSGISTLVEQNLIFYPAGPAGLFWVRK